MKPLGDPHNFGKRVALTAEGLISKPRNLFWEWLFLSPASPFRRLIQQIASAKEVPSPFRLFPDLTFSADSLLAGGTVSCLKLTPFSDSHISPDLCEAIGSVIGLVTTMGIADLHRDNVVCGFSTDGNPVFAPLDIESALETYTLPSQTHLLPSAEMPGDLCGFSGFLKLLPCNDDHPRDLSLVTALARGYLGAVDLVLDHATEISNVLRSRDDFAQIPVRLFLRATRQYYSWLEKTGQAVEPPLQESEHEQLRRGDIPYFIRRLESSDVLYFHEAHTLAPAKLTNALTERGLSNSMNFSQGRATQLFADTQKNNELIKAGVLQLIRLCDDNRQTGRFRHADLSCEFDAGEIFVTWRDKLKVKCARK